MRGERTRGEFRGAADVDESCRSSDFGALILRSPGKQLSFLDLVCVVELGRAISCLKQW